MRELYDDDVFYPRENYPASPIINNIKYQLYSHITVPQRKEERGEGRLINIKHPGLCNL